MSLLPFYDLRVQMTNACALRCRHCFASSSTPGDDELSLDEIRNLIQDYLIPRGLKWVVMTGGEPLLRFNECLELTRLCRKRGVVPRINTGGFVKNVEDKIRALIAAGIETIMLPLEAASAELHDAFCGVSGVFDNTIAIFELISELGGTSCMRVTIFNWNVDEIPELLQLARDIGVSKFRIRPELPAGQALRHPEYPTIAQIQHVTKFLLQERTLAQDIQIEFLNPHFQFLYSPVQEDYDVCTCGVTKAFLTSEGNIKPCGFYKDTFGSIRDSSFPELWEQDPHPVLRRLRSAEPFKECSDCEHWSICRGGCPVVTYDDWGNFDGECRYCPLQNDLAMLESQVGE